MPAKIRASEKTLAAETPELVTTGEDMPRGPAGSAAGLSADDVDRRLVSLITRLHSQHGLGFSSEQALSALRALFPDDTPQQHAAVRRVLTGLPGLHRSMDGTYVLPAAPYDSIKHRHWRMSMGYVDISDAARIHELLALSDNRTEGMERLMDRLHTALYSAIGEDWDPYLL